MSEQLSSYEFVSPPSLTLIPEGDDIMRHCFLIEHYGSFARSGVSLEPTHSGGDGPIHKIVLD